MWKNTVFLFRRRKVMSNFRANIPSWHAMILICDHIKNCVMHIAHHGDALMPLNKRAFWKLLTGDNFWKSFKKFGVKSRTLASHSPLSDIGPDMEDEYKQDNFQLWTINIAIPIWTFQTCLLFGVLFYFHFPRNMKVYCFVVCSTFTVSEIWRSIIWWRVPLSLSQKGQQQYTWRDWPVVWDDAFIYCGDRGGLPYILARRMLPQWWSRVWMLKRLEYRYKI